MQCAELCILTNPQVQEDVMVFLRSIRLARNRLKEAESRREASEATAARLEAELKCLKTEESSKLAAVNADEARLMKAIAEDDMNMGHGLERIQDTASWLQSTIAEVRPPSTWRRHGTDIKYAVWSCLLKYACPNKVFCRQPTISLARCTYSKELQLMNRSVFML